MKVLKAITAFFLRCFGAPIHDVKTGELLGRVFVFRWKGKIRVVGLPKPVAVAFMPRGDIKYWYQDLGFSRPESPDFSSIAEGKSDKCGR